MMTDRIRRFTRWGAFPLALALALLVLAGAWGQTTKCDKLIVGSTAFSTGAINLAPGTTAVRGIYFGSDVTLYRSAANVLKTDDSLTVVGTLTVGTLAHTNLTVTGTADLGDAAGDAIHVHGTPTLYEATTCSKTLDVTGATTLTGALVSKDAVTLGDAVGDAILVSGTLTCAEATSCSKTLGVTGAATLGSAIVTAGETVGTTLVVTGDVTGNGNWIIGNAVGDTATVNATPTFAENVACSKALAVTGAATLGSAVVTAGETVGTTLVVTGAVTGNGAWVIGDAVGDTVTVNGAPTFAENVVMSKALGVTGAATLGSCIVTAGETVGTTLVVTGDITGNGAWNIGNAAGDVVTVTGTATFGQDITASQDLDITDELTVAGNSILGNAVGDTLTVNATPTFAENVGCAKALAVTGLVTVGTTLGVAGNLTATGAANVLGDASTDVTTNVGRMVMRSVADAGPMTNTPGSLGEIVLETTTLEFYGCTAAGSPGTWQKMTP